MGWKNKQVMPMPNLYPNEFNGNLLNIPGDLVDMHRKCWLVFSVEGAGCGGW